MKHKPSKKIIFLADMSTGGGEAKKVFLIVPTDFQVILSIDVIPQIKIDCPFIQGRGEGGGWYLQFTYNTHM